MDIRQSIGALIALALTCSAYAISPGQIDTFQDGTTQNWENGGAAGAPPVVNVNGGGPAGAGDRFIMVTSVGGGNPGNRLTVYNEDDWPGDYFNQGIMAIDVDLRNLGKTSLSIRLAFKMSDSPFSDGYLSDPFSLDAGSGWQHAIFLITPGTMTAVGAPDDFNTFFTSSIFQVRFINEVGDTNLNGDPIVAQLGIDNIHAVPEPSSFVLAAVGLAGFAAARRRNRGKS